jgi:DNA repair exonuclease SbcCD nuclease subunit
MTDVPYGLIADVHLHAWSAFATVTPDKLNSRLAGLIAEIWRTAQEVKRCGGDTLVIAGDLFHVRGSVAPTVLNPAQDALREIRRELGLNVVIIPGNHDLEGRDSDRVGASVTALEDTGCLVVHEPMRYGDVFLVPWVEKVSELRDVLNLKGHPKCDLIIHAPVNGVLLGLPDNGLDPAWLASLGFRRVFAGHYHNHKSFEDGKVWSIGALAHNTWNDVGSVAGACLVFPDRVEHLPSQLPRFIDLTPEHTEQQIRELAPGNYLRVRTTSTKNAEINELRAYLEKLGALGVVIISIKAPVRERDGTLAASVAAGASIERSVSDYVKGQKLPNEKDVEIAALKVLAEAEVA